MFKSLQPLLGNQQRLDGGAMYGNVPKALWQRWSSPDNDNRITLSTRALLVQESNRNILFETGIGAYMPPKLKERFGVVESEHVLLDSLAKQGLSDKDIDIVVLSHLHFDHAGGLLSTFKEDQSPQLLFPKAQFVISQAAFDRAINPHPRDKASFIPELMTQLQDKPKRLHLVTADSCELLGENYRFHYSDGHTPGLLMTEVKHPEQALLFVSDLIPATPWVHLPITMGYDRAPELLIDEKKSLLDYVVANNIALFFTHDPDCAQACVTQDEKGRFSIKN